MQNKCKHNDIYSVDLNIKGKTQNIYFGISPKSLENDVMKRVEDEKKTRNTTDVTIRICKQSQCCQHEINVNVDVKACTHTNTNKERATITIYSRRKVS